MSPLCILLFLFFQEIEVQNKKIIVVYVPVPQLKQFHKVQVRLIRELEKKFGGRHVVFVAKVSVFSSKFMRAPYDYLAVIVIFSNQLLYASTFYIFRKLF